MKDGTKNAAPPSPEPRRTTGDVHRLAELVNLGERALDAVDNLAGEARAELERERLLGAVDRVTDHQAGGLFVHLRRKTCSAVLPWRQRAKCTPNNAALADNTYQQVSRRGKGSGGAGRAASERGARTPIGADVANSGQRLNAGMPRKKHLAHLDSGLVALELNDLADKALRPHAHQLVHSGPLDLRGDYHGSGDHVDLANIVVRAAGV